MKKTNYQQKNMQHTEVGLVLCCISPNIAHLIFVMQLSKTMDRPAPIRKEMYRIIRYVLNETRRYGLKFYPKRSSWFIQAFSDSDFAGDRETRRSVYGYFVYICGIPIA